MDATTTPHATQEAPIVYTRKGANYMSVTELSEKLGVHRNTILYWIQQGQLDAVRLGLAEKSPWAIPEEKANKLIENFAKAE